MIEFLKRAYEELYDLPNFYLGIEDGWKSHTFSVLFLILMIAGFTFIIKSMLQVRKSRKERMKMLRRMNKTLLGPYDQKLNEKNENIR